jgi:hypothetical protein
MMHVRFLRIIICTKALGPGVLAVDMASLGILAGISGRRVHPYLEPAIDAPECIIVAIDMCKKGIFGCVVAKIAIGRIAGSQGIAQLSAQQTGENRRIRRHGAGINALCKNGPKDSTAYHI